MLLSILLYTFYIISIFIIHMNVYKDFLISNNLRNCVDLHFFYVDYIQVYFINVMKVIYIYIIICIIFLFFDMPLFRQTRHYIMMIIQYLFNLR